MAATAAPARCFYHPDRQALAVLAPKLKSELGFGPVEYSYIVSAFLIAYSLGFAVCGRIIDRYGVKLVLAGALLFWSLTTMAHAAAAGWMTLAVLRFLLGFGESFNGPSGVKAISEWAPPRERGVSIAIFTNGYVMGAILAPPRHRQAPPRTPAAARVCERDGVAAVRKEVRMRTSGMR